MRAGASGSDLAAVIVVVMVFKLSVRARRECEDRK